jgi:hypothetical protein
MSLTTAIVLVLALYVLHQDFWFWDDARPIVFGFLPVGLFYHVAYTVVISLVLRSLVKHHWPSHLDKATTPE